MGNTKKSTQGEAPAGAAPLSVEQLQERLNAAEAALTAEREAHDATKAELLQFQQDLETAIAENEAAKGIISDLEAKYADKAAEVKADKAVITVEKQQYEVLPGNYSYEGEVVNAKVLKSNSKLAAKLIEIGAGFIKKLEA